MGASPLLAKTCSANVNVRGCEPDRVNDLLGMYRRLGTEMRRLREAQASGELIIVRGPVDLKIEHEPVYDRRGEDAFPAPRPSFSHRACCWYSRTGQGRGDERTQ